MMCAVEDRGELASRPATLRMALCKIPCLGVAERCATSTYWHLPSPRPLATSRNLGFSPPALLISDFGTWQLRCQAR